MEFAAHFNGYALQTIAFKSSSTYGAALILEADSERKSTAFENSR